MLSLLENAKALSWLDKTCRTILIAWIIRITLFLFWFTIFAIFTTHLRQLFFILLWQLVGISFYRSALWLPILGT